MSSVANYACGNISLQRESTSARINLFAKAQIGERNQTLSFGFSCNTRLAVIAKKKFCSNFIPGVSSVTNTFPSDSVSCQAMTQ